jgi:DNA-binding transcriptional regulator YiaG
MGKMEQTLKAEIVRLSKKQVRVTCVPLAREFRRLKRLVAEMRRTLAGLKSVGAEIEARLMAEKASLDAPAEEVQSSRISGRLIKKLRTRLGISQGDLAALVGVSAGAVAFWEQGRSRPRERTKTAIVALRKLGRRDVKKLLAEKPQAPKRKTKQAKKTRRKRRK